MFAAKNGYTELDKVFGSARTWDAHMEISEDERVTQLIDRICNGDQQVWNEIIKMWNRRLLAFCSARCWGTAAAEDAVQETWIAAIKNAESFRGKSGKDLMNWLMRVATNESANQGRRARRYSNESIETIESEKAKTNKGQDELHRLMESEQASVFESCLQEIEAIFRQVIVLRLNGASYQEITDSVGIPSGTVGTRILRGTKDMKFCIESKLS